MNSLLVIEGILPPRAIWKSILDNWRAKSLGASRWFTEELTVSLSEL
jgi:hypothetical protein